MRISDWSSDVCSSDLPCHARYGRRSTDPARNIGPRDRVAVAPAAGGLTGCTGMADGARSEHPGLQRQLDRLAALSPGRDVLGLDRILRLLGTLGNPHEALPPVFHVAGTNGKIGRAHVWNPV